MEDVDVFWMRTMQGSLGQLGQFCEISLSLYHQEAIQSMSSVSLSHNCHCFDPSAVELRLCR